MRRVLFLFFLFLFEYSFSQEYFNFFYTNIPKSKYDKYSIANSNAIGWLQTGRYTWPASCKDCYDLSRDSKLSPLFIDSLVKLYDKSIMDTLYSKKYVPSNHYFGVEKGKLSPVIIKTLYKITKDKVEPLLQIKMTFYERENSLPGILNIEFLQIDKLRKFDSKLVLESYRKQLKDDKDEAPPLIEKL